LKNWKRNLYVVAFSEMIAITGLAFIIPFLPLFVKELGVSDIDQIARWSGLLISAPALLVIIVSPLWGFIADRVGRKPMIERAIFGSAVTILLMSMVNNVYQLFFLRLMQGFLTGTIAACTALISASSPANKMAYSLGLLQTGVFMGNFIGPLIGGVAAGFFGFQNSFRITSILLFIAGFLVLFLVEEKFSPDTASRTKKKVKVPFKEKMVFMLKYKQVLIMLIILFLVQFSVKAITPIFPLFVDTMVSDPQKVSTFTGLMFALTGLTSAFSAMNIGKIIEKKPILFILIASLSGAGIFFLLQAFVVNITQLSLIRICLGLFYGSIIPIANTVISLSTPYQHKGKIFGISNSTTFLGNILGPITGSFVMTTFNIPTVFLLTGSIVILAGLILPLSIKDYLSKNSEWNQKSHLITKKEPVIVKDN